LGELLGDRADLVDDGAAAAVVAIGIPDRSDVVSGSGPISTVALGSAPNVAIVDAPDSLTAVAGQIVNVQVVLEGRGVAGKKSVVVLQRRGVEVARADHTWEGDGRATITLAHVATAGATALSVHVHPVDGERRTGDNRADVQVVAAGRSLNVYVIEPRTSWPAGFVRRTLETDPAFRVSSVLHLSRGIAARAGEPPRQLTTTDLLPFDVLLVGAPEELRENEVQALREFAAVRGGSVILLPDRRPSGAYVKLLLADLRLRSTAAPSEQLLREPQLLDPAGLLASELVVVPGAESVAATLAATTERSPVLISWPVGDGRILFSGALDAWRYRGDPKSTFSRFWRRTVIEAALAAPSRLDLRLTPAVVRPHQPARLTVRVRRTEITTSASQGNVRVPAVGADLVARDGTMEMIRLWPTVEAGVFEADVRAAAAGTYDVRVTSEHGASADAALIVDGDAGLAFPPSHLERIPELTGGVAVQATNLEPLVQHLAGLPRLSHAAVIHPLRSPWWMLLFALALSGEWILRRRAGLR
jgi:hypothetical protein